MHVIQQIGAVAGLGAFFGLAVLAFLYFAQARHVRDLEEKATFVPDDLEIEPVPEPVAVAETAGGEEGTAEAAPEQPAPAARKPRSEAEAARQIEIARAKAERRARFEERRRTPGSRPSEPALSPRRMPEPRAMVVIGLGVVVLIVGVVFGAGRILGGGSDSDSGSSSSGVQAGSTGPPPEVAVLNGTPVPGLAAKIGQQARDGGFKLGAVTNTDTPFTETTVMFDQSVDKNAQADARTVAGKLQIQKVEPMSSDVKKIAEGASVAIIVGEDRAGT